MKFDSTPGTTTFYGPDSSTATIEHVLSFKYLGISLNTTPCCLFKDFNDHVRRKATSYLYAVLSLVKTGPDRAKLAHTLWTRITLPSILYVTEIISLT